MTKLVLQSGAVLQKRIDAFAKTVKATQQEAHDIGVQVVGHYEKHDDYTLIARFVGAKIGKRRKGERKFTISDDFPGVCGTLRKNVVAWLTRFTDLRFNGEGMIYRMNRKSETYLAHVAQNNGKPVDVETAAATPWWTLDGAQRDASRNAIDLLNLLAMADSIGKRIQTAIDADAEREKGDESHAYVPEQLGDMKAFADAIQKAKDDFIAARKVNVVNLKAEREARKAAKPVAGADVARPVTTGAAAAGTPLSEAA